MPSRNLSNTVVRNLHTLIMARLGVHKPQLYEHMEILNEKDTL